jgi:pimeloyl-ACP methyl ester carboxylesterase
MSQISPDNGTNTTHTLHSKDGTAIGYYTIGSGPSVIVIPGVLSMAANYAAFARVLAEHFTVHTIERRGRGISGPQGADYSIAKECEDVLALQKKTGAAFIVGHSFGGFVALEAARNNMALTKMAAYEPGVSIDGCIPMTWVPVYEQKLARKAYFDAFIAYVIAMGPERAQKTPHWLMKIILLLALKPHERRQRLTLLHEGLREHQEEVRLDNTYKNYREISAGVLLMYGGKTGLRWANLAMMRLAEVLLHSETKEFPRLDHFGIDKNAPLDVANAVAEYFLK